jgi:hypothetical protein
MSVVRGFPPGDSNLTKDELDAVQASMKEMQRGVWRHLKTPNVPSIGALDEHIESLIDHLLKDPSLGPYGGYKWNRWTGNTMIWEQMFWVYIAPNNTIRVEFDPSIGIPRETQENGRWVRGFQ